MENIAMRSLGLIDVAQGKLVSVSGWDTNPDNLANATDGDSNTATGWGSTTLGVAAGYLGYFDLDLESIMKVLFSIKTGFYNSTSTTRHIYVYLYVKDNVGDNYRPVRQGPISQDSTSTSEVIGEDSIITSGRYFRIGYYLTNTGTGLARLYSINAFKLV